VFLFFLALWTYELLAENPVPESISRAIPDEWKFWLAKGLHVAAYAFLTIFAAFLPIQRLHFWLVVMLLVLHGIATEVGQDYVHGRDGSLRDVLLDWAGVGLGLFALWCMHKLPGEKPQW
jgi:VanZ family protein